MRIVLPLNTPTTPSDAPPFTSNGIEKEVQ